jgi:hypothetical protein
LDDLELVAGVIAVEIAQSIGGNHQTVCHSTN